MRIKKSLFAVTAMALAMLAFAASAMAVTEDKLVHVSTGTTIPAGRELTGNGWAQFLATNGTGGMKCHVTSSIVTTGTTGTTGHVKSFNPVTSKCTGSGFFSFQGCNELTSDTTTNTSPHGSTNYIWDATATKNDFSIFNTIDPHMVLHFKPKGSCVLNGSEITLTFTEITLSPLNTTNKRVVTNTAGNLGNTAATGEPIAGWELEGIGIAHIGGSEVEVKATGEFELTAADRCTWKFAADIP
jgi:hypothetical protein